MQIFATRVWGFGFKWKPVATFGSAGHVKRLLLLANRGDRLLFVGTKTGRTSAENQGRLLGMAEIGFESFRTLDVIERSELDPRDFDPSGNYKFPFAVALLRGWEFNNPPLLTDVLSAQLSMIATPGVEKISDEDALRVLALETTALPLPKSPKLDEMRRWNERLRPTKGPAPSDAQYTVNRSAQNAFYTYLLRFGNRDVWKVGHSQDVTSRVEEINQHVPVEVLNEKWTIFLTHKWPDALSAYEMEQRILSRMQGKRSGFERLQCRQKEVETAFAAAIVGA